MNKSVDTPKKKHAHHYHIFRFGAYSAIRCKACGKAIDPQIGNKLAKNFKYVAEAPK